MPSSVAWTREFDDALAARARAAWPRELVALLGGHERADRRVRVVALEPVPNAAGAAGDAFAVDPVAFARAEAGLRARGLAFVGFVHSHPGGSAAPSQRDLRELWPGCVQVVAALPSARGPVARGAYTIDGGVAHPLRITVLDEVPA